MTCAMHLPCRKVGRLCLGHLGIAAYCAAAGVEVTEFQDAAGADPSLWERVRPYWETQPFYVERNPLTAYDLAQGQYRCPSK